LVARAIHRLSDRRDGDFVAVNCGAIPKDLMEREFFGHLKGAFTGANADKRGFLDSADGGTLFLDEIGEISQDAGQTAAGAGRPGVHAPGGNCKR
jgi:transcriptional regulator with PAS, ATPase and Fis domain